MTLAAVRFLPGPRIVHVPTGTTLLHAAQIGQVPIGSSCDGQGACAWCRVIVVTGANNLGPRDQRELDLAHKHDLADDERIACLCPVNGDVSIATEYWGYQRPAP